MEGAFLSKAGARGRFLEGGFREEGGADIKGGVSERKTTNF